MNNSIFDKIFDKIYCINLNERKDRWELAEKEFNYLGIKNYVRFPAIKNLDGRIGCRNSHLTIINDAKINKYKKILIFEDDFIFINKDKDLISNIIEQISKIKYDLFYLGATVEPNIGRFQIISENIVKTNFAYTTHAYSIDSSLYDYILTEAPKFPIIDVFYQQKIVPLGRCYISNPMVCLQRNSHSDIEKKYVDYDWMVDYFNLVLNKCDGKS